MNLNRSGKGGASFLGLFDYVFTGQTASLLSMQ